MWSGCKTHQIWHTVCVISNRNVGNLEIWNREVVSRGEIWSSGGGEPWARPLRKARPAGPDSRPMRSEDCGFGRMGARGGAERGEWAGEKSLVGEVSDDNGKCSAGQSRLSSEYGSSWWRIVSKNDFCILWPWLLNIMGLGCLLRGLRTFAER